MTRTTSKKNQFDTNKTADFVRQLHLNRLKFRSRKLKENVHSTLSQFLNFVFSCVGILKKTLYELLKKFDKKPNAFLSVLLIYFLSNSSGKVFSSMFFF